MLKTHCREIWPLPLEAQFALEALGVRIAGGRKDRDYSQWVWAGTQADFIEAAHRHYAYYAAEASTALLGMSGRLQGEWRRALAEEGMPSEAIESYRGAFAPLA